jgi:hypothetical protein
LIPTESEGYIVCDKDWNRCKVKGINYVKLSYLSSIIGGNPSVTILKIIQSNESEEVLCAFPKWKENFNIINNLYEEAFEDIKNGCKSVEDIQDRKTLALKIKEKWYSPCIFKVKGSSDREKSIKDWLCTQNPKKLIDQLKKYQ